MGSQMVMAEHLSLVEQHGGQQAALLSMGGAPMSGGSGDQMSDKNSNLTLQEPFLKLTNSIKHPNLPQQNSNAVQKKRRYPLIKFSRPSRRRGPDRRRGWQAQAPLAVTFRFHVPAGDWQITCARRAFWRCSAASRTGFHWACRLISRCNQSRPTSI